MKSVIRVLLAVLLAAVLLTGVSGACIKYCLGMETEENIFLLPFALLKTSAEPDETEAPTLPEITTVPTEAETAPPATETNPPTEVTEPPVPVVDESWFDDALFIGESRTMGLRGYGRLGNADYFCAECLTVYGVLGISASDVNFPEQSLESLLSWRSYSKIYIHLGINEVGGDLDAFAAQYRKIIDLIRKKQPDAHIILQAVLALSEGYSSNPSFSRENVQAMNDRIAALAEEEGLLFSDVNRLMADENGYLRRELTFDGCHLYAEGCRQWAQWLLEEAKTLNIP